MDRKVSRGSSKVVGFLLNLLNMSLGKTKDDQLLRVRDEELEQTSRVAIYHR